MRNVDFYYLRTTVKHPGRKLLTLDNIDWYNIDTLFRMPLSSGKEMLWADAPSSTKRKRKWFYESAKKSFFRNVTGLLLSRFWAYTTFELL